VFPALNADERVVYCQTRYLHPVGDRKYDNPSSRLGSNPRVGVVRPPGQPAAGVVVVCEGLPDALTAAQAGYRAVGVLGSTLPDAIVARRVARLAAGATIVSLFDADEAGRSAAERFNRLLEHEHDGAIIDISPPVDHGDLNAWARAEPGWAAFLTDSLTHLGHPIPPDPPRPPPRHDDPTISFDAPAPAGLP
jgi:hypothetical protein